MCTLKLRKFLFKKRIYYVTSSPTRYRDLLRAERSGNRVTVTATFLAHVHTGPGAHKAPCKMDSGSLSRG